jgi:Peptidase family M23
VAASGTRHVGTVIDPLARDDGETEPELLLPGEASAGEAPPERGSTPEPPKQVDEIERQSAAPADPGEAPPLDSDSELEMDPASSDGVHPVKARLLARAAAVRGRAGRRAPDASGRFDEIGQEGSDRDPGELTRAPPAAPNPRAALVPRGRAPLSPNMVALFGTLLGLALVASIIALVMRLGPSHWSDPESTAAGAATPTVAAAPAEATPKPKRVKLPGPWRIADAKDDANSRIVEGKVGSDAFLTAVQGAGVEKGQAYRVFNALKDLRNLDKCDRSDSFVVLLDKASSRVTAFEYVVSKEEVYQARQDASGELKGAKLDFKIERGEVRGAFLVDGSDIDAAAEHGGLERGMAAALSKALDGHMSLDDLERGDVIRVLCQEVTVLGEFSRYAGIEALEIRRGNGKEAPFRLYYFRGDKERGYYDDKGRSPYEGGWRKPIKDAPITSHFNPKRMHPILHKIMPHTGTDFGATVGTPVGASSYGTVSFLGPAGPSGNLVKIEHPGGIETGYAHLSRFADGLHVGDKVKRLQLIGYVGSTGRSTGPHLHFTAKRNGEFFDAETLNLDGMRVITKEERDAFAHARQKYDTELDAIALPAPLPAAAAPVAAASSAKVEEDLGVGGPEPEAPAATQPKGGAPAAPAAPGANPVYLTDKELIKRQAASDDGEVEE